MSVKATPEELIKEARKQLTASRLEFSFDIFKKFIDQNLTALIDHSVKKTINGEIAYFELPFIETKNLFFKFLKQNSLKVYISDNRVTDEDVIYFQERLKGRTYYKDGLEVYYPQEYHEIKKILIFAGKKAADRMQGMDSRNMPIYFNTITSNFKDNESILIFK